MVNIPSRTPLKLVVKRKNQNFGSTLEVTSATENQNLYKMEASSKDTYTSEVKQNKNSYELMSFGMFAFGPIVIVV